MVYHRREWQTTSAFLPGEPHEQYEKAKDMTLKDECRPQIGRCQYAIREEQINSSRKNEDSESKQQQRPVVDVSGW